MRKGKNLAYSNYQKNLNLHSLNSVLNLSEDYRKFNYGIFENFSSSLIKTEENNIKDRHNLSARFGYLPFNKTEAGIALINDIYSDSRKIDLNQYSSLKTIVYAKYSPLNNSFVSPYFGYANKTQVNQKDYGGIYGFEIVLNKIPFSDLKISTRANYENEEISPRKNMDRFLNARVEGNVDNKLKNALISNYSFKKNDFYLQADSLTQKTYNVAKNIQAREEMDYFLKDIIYFGESSDAFNIELGVESQWRQIDRNTKYKSLQNPVESVFDLRTEEFQLTLNALASYQVKDAYFDFSYNYSDKDEKYKPKRIEGVNIIIYNERERRESMKNNNSLRQSLSFQSRISISKNDEVALSFLQSKFQYETPAEDNFDDRDELLSIARASYIRRFSSNFSADFNFEGALNQVAYIYAEKSSNNIMKRIIKISSGSSYNSSVLRSFNYFETSANYSVYDFEDKVSSLKSYSFRQYFAADSTSIRITKKLSFNFAGALKLSEQGTLNWDQFKEKPLRHIREILMEPKLSIAIWGVNFSVGARFFSYSTFKYAEGKKNLESEYKSSGPLSEIIWNFGNKLRISFKGNYEFIHFDRGAKREVANVSFETEWRL